MSLPNPSFRCTTVPFIRRLAGIRKRPRDEIERRGRHFPSTYVMSSIPAILPSVMAIRYVVKNINWQYKPPQKCDRAAGSRTLLQNHNSRFVIRNKLNWFCSHKAARYMATLTARQWASVFERCTTGGCCCFYYPLVKDFKFCLFNVQSFYEGRMR